MAWNNSNWLKKIVDIQNITLEYKDKGCTQEWIYKKLIKPTYNISRGTYYRYLAVAAKAELKKKEITLPAIGNLKKCVNLL